MLYQSPPNSATVANLMFVKPLSFITTALTAHARCRGMARPFALNEKLLASDGNSKLPNAALFRDLYR